VTAARPAPAPVLLRALAGKASPGTRLRPLLRWTWGGPLRPVLVLLLVVLALRLALWSNPPPRGVLVYGAVMGLLYGLIAFGLILVHRATRIINFAQAEIGAAAAVLAVLMVKVNGVPYVVALPLALVAGVASGWLVEVLVVRRFARAPRLVLSVATIGVSLVFGAVQLILPFVFGVTSELGIDARPIETPFSAVEVEIYPIVFDANSVVVVLAAFAVLVGLVAFFRRTDLGFAVRGCAENVDRAVLLGIPVHRVSRVVWMLAGALSALGVFLRVPLTGLPVGTSVGPYVLLYALAAAVIGRMERFGTALLAAVTLGMAEQAVYFSTQDPNVAVALTLPVLLVTMLLQRGRLSRGQDTGIASWALAKEYRVTPPELRGLLEVRIGTKAWALLVLAAALAVPHLLGPTQQVLASLVVVYGIVALSLVILTGWSGQISLGQWGFAGLGAAVAGSVATRLEGDFFVALLLAGLAGAAFAVVIGLPALRLQGLYLAVTTLSFALAVQVFLLSPSYFGWLLPPQGEYVERPLLFQRFDTVGAVPYYYVCLAVLLLCLASCRALRQSRAGRLLIAVRDNPRGAQAYGVRVRAAKLWAFGISGFWAALAGALFVYQQGAVDTAAFGPDVSLMLLVVVVIGGSTSLPGAMLGTLYIGILKYSGLSDGLQLLGAGLGSLLLLYFLPGGLAAGYYGARDWLLRRIARRRGVLVPSLDADRRVDSETAAEPGPGSLALPQDAPGRLAAIRLACDPVPAPADRAEEPVLTCPTCGMSIPLSAAPYHEHLMATSR
jgi:branched-chain amino acid transport system permease protein